MPIKFIDVEKYKTRYEQKFPLNKLVEYTGSHKPCTILCHVHGLVENLNFHSIMHTKLGCPKCTKEFSKSGTRALEGDLGLAGAKYSRKFPLNKLIKYTGSNKPCTIFCHVHGEVENLKFSSVMRSPKGCPLCNEQLSQRSERTRLKDFELARIKYRKKFPKNDILEYTNSVSKYVIKCAVHGRVEARYSSLFRSKYGCPECTLDARKSKKKPIQEDLEQSELKEKMLNSDNPKEIAVEALSNPDNIGSTVKPLFYENPEELLNENFVLVPFYKDLRLSAGSGQFTTSLETSSIPLSLQDLRLKGINPKKVICCKVHGDSMEPLLQDGAMVGIDTSDTEIQSGKMYAFVEAEGSLRIKSLIKVDHLHIKIHSVNYAYSTEIVKASSIKVIGRLFWASTTF